MELNEVLVEGKKFKGAALRACRMYARAKPWAGSIEERKAKLEAFNAELAAAHGVPAPTLRYVNVEANLVNGAAGYDPDDKVIVLGYRLSVVSYLQMFARHCGKSRVGMVRWSVNLFKRKFPKSYAGCRWDASHAMLVRDLSLAN